MDKLQLKTPVCLMIFNRPETTEKVFEAIREAKPSKLLIVADGPRANQPEDVSKCAAAQAIINRVDWNCEVLKNYSDINLGCRNRVYSGLNWVFDLVEEAIILEDDCLPHPTFFRFCEELLERYRSSEQIMVISGDNFQFGHNCQENSSYERGNLHLAIDLRNKAVKINATYPPFHKNLGDALQTSGKLEEAIASYKRALALNPNYSEAHKKLGDVLLKLERIDESINFYEQALAINSEYIGAVNNLGLAFLCKEWYEHAQKVFHQSFFKRYSLTQEKLAKFDPTNLMETGKDSKTLNTSRFQLIDRIDQLNYLIEKKLIDSSFQNLVNRYHCLLNELDSQVNPVPYTPLTQQQAELFAGYYDKIIYYTDAPHVSGSAVNEGLDWKSIEKSYQASSVVYFDDFLTPNTLEGLRKFCLESTVFFRHSEAGFVASYMHEGFNCTQLYQIIADLKRNLPSVLGGLSLNNMWIYRYASRGNGVKTHTDEASVTINFWITSDEANLNLNSGSGLVVYDQKQPFDWDWLKYNMHKDDPHIQAQIKAFLETAHSLNIPYRCNRAVIFHSKLFHRSDPFHFRDSFESRRMNVTMLFGNVGKESASLK